MWHSSSSRSRGSLILGSNWILGFEPPFRLAQVLLSDHTLAIEASILGSHDPGIDKVNDVCAPPYTGLNIPRSAAEKSVS